MSCDPTDEIAALRAKLAEAEKEIAEERQRLNNEMAGCAFSEGVMREERDAARASEAELREGLRAAVGWMEREMAFAAPERGRVPVGPNERDMLATLRALAADAPNGDEKGTTG